MKGGELLEGGLEAKEGEKFEKKSKGGRRLKRSVRRGGLFCTSLTPGRRRKGRASRASRGGEPRRRRVAQGQGACDSPGQFFWRWAALGWRLSYARARPASTGTCAGSAAVSGQSRRRHVLPLALGCCLWLLLAGTGAARGVDVLVAVLGQHTLRGVWSRQAAA